MVQIAAVVGLASLFAWAMLSIIVSRSSPEFRIENYTLFRDPDGLFIYYGQGGPFGMAGASVDANGTTPAYVYIRKDAIGGNFTFWDTYFHERCHVRTDLPILLEEAKCYLEGGTGALFWPKPALAVISEK